MSPLFATHAIHAGIKKTEHTREKAPPTHIDKQNSEKTEIHEQTGGRRLCVCLCMYVCVCMCVGVCVHVCVCARASASACQKMLYRTFGEACQHSTCKGNPSDSFSRSKTLKSHSSALSRHARSPCSCAGRCHFFQGPTSFDATTTVIKQDAP